MLSVAVAGGLEQRALLCDALLAVTCRLEDLAPESAPPVPVTVPDVPPAAAGMTETAFWVEMDRIIQAARYTNRMRTADESGALFAAVDLGARWRAATGLPLPTRPKGRSR